MRISSVEKRQLAVSAGRGNLVDLEKLLLALPIDEPSEAIANISTTEGVMTTAERQKFNAVLAVLRKFGFINQ
jgi:hypothetical protein